MKIFSNIIYAACISFFSVFSCVVNADNVDDYLLKKMVDGNIPGLQIAVVKDGKIVKSSSYGFANLQDSIKVDDTTVFNLASITKAFTSVAIMQLVEQNKLILSTPISTYFSDLPEKWRNITVEQLVTHTSGLPDVMNHRWRLIASDGEEASWELLKQRALYSEPGSQFHYNQTNYLLLGSIIKQASGQSYADLITQFQFSRVALPQTEAAGFTHFVSINKHQAQDYKINNAGERVQSQGSFPAFIRAGVGMSSTALEMAKWLIALQNNQFFSTKNSLKHLWTKAKLSDDHGAHKNQKMNPYAMGWYVIDNKINPSIVSAGGGQSALVTYPDDSLSIVILTNLGGSNPQRFIDDVAGYYLTDFGLTPQVKGLKNHLDVSGYANSLKIINRIEKNTPAKFKANELNDLAHILIKHQRAPQAKEIIRATNHLFSKMIINDTILKTYVGHYDLPDFSIEVTVEASALFIQVKGQDRLPVFAESKTEFVLKIVDAKISFQKTDAGVIKSLTLHQGQQNLVGEKVK